MTRRAVHFDMETSDPDDVMTLALLATHPRAELIGVTIAPGRSDQVALVQHVLKLLNVTCPVGSDIRDDIDQKSHVSGFHRKWLGEIGPRDAASSNYLVLHKSSRHPGATLLTGGPLKNLGEHPPAFPRWVGQGGFAGDSVVPPEHRLAKFAGRETCPTFNFNGAPAIALNMVADRRFGEKLLVSKNVCHGVSWDHNFHARVEALPKRTAGLDLCLEGMRRYLKEHPDGKKLHDPLAMTVAIDRSVCDFRRVMMYRAKGEWGARLDPNGECEISVSVDRERFFQVLTEVA